MRFVIYNTDKWRHDPEEKPFEKAVFDEKRKCYFIEVNTIEELMGIVKKTGRNLVVGYSELDIYDETPDDVGEPFIEVYNDYRE